VTEIRTHDLRFSMAEADAFLRRNWGEALDERWFTYYDKMVLEFEDCGTQQPITMLKGQVPD
jgi:hypothetical protein